MAAIRLRPKNAARCQTSARRGSGVAEELLGRVFERFAKGDDSPGVGLGLAIARDIVEAHGGAIAVESVAGEGTTVRLVLPIAA